MVPPRCLRALVCTLVTSLATGCVLIDPHVRIDEEVKYTGQGFYTGLPEAIDRADKLRRKYFDAVSEHSKFRSVTGLALIPLSASALYLGFASSANADLAAGLGLAAAGTYGIGNYLHSSPRQVAYLNGASAVTCSVLAMRPLLIKDGEYTKLASGLGEIGTSTAEVNTKLGVVTAALADVPDGSAIAKDARAQSTQAKALVSQAGDVHSRGLLLKRRIETAGTSLNQAIDRIQVKVSEQVLKTEPELASVMTIAGSLGQWAGALGSVPTLVPQTQGVTAGAGASPEGAPRIGAHSKQEQERVANEEALRAAVNDLANATRTAAANVRTVADIVNAADELATQSGSLGECDAAAVPATLSILPDTTTAEIAAGSSLSFVITDQSGIPQAVRLAGPTSDKVTMTTDATGGTLLVQIVAAADAPASAYQLHVRDSTGRQSRAIAIIVKEQAEAIRVDDPPGEKTWEDFLDEAEKSLITSKENAEDVQKMLNSALEEDLVIDGKFGTKTRDAIAAYQKQHQANLELAGRSDEKLRILTTAGRNKLLAEHPPAD